MILTLYIFQLISKDRAQVKKAYRILKWIIIGYAVVNLILFLITLIFYPDQSAFLDRAFGKYWLSYWVMMISAICLPFTLLYKNLGLKPFYLLFVSFMMKIGWYFERYVIFIADYSIGQFKPENKSDWLTSPWSVLIITLIQGIIIALILIGMVKLLVRNKERSFQKN